MLKQACATAVAVAALGLFGPPAQGAMITFQFGGVIDVVDDPDNVLEGAVQAGNTFSGSYTFDPDTPDSYPDDPEFGVYENASLTVSLGNLTLVSQANDNNLIAVTDRPSYDRFVMGSYGFQSAGFSIHELDLSLYDSTATAFDSDALPTTPPDLGAFDPQTAFDRAFFITGNRDGGPDFVIFGTVTTLTPEPTSLMLMFFGAVVFMRVRRR